MQHTLKRTTFLCAVLLPVLGGGCGVEEELPVSESEEDPQGQELVSEEGGASPMIGAAEATARAAGPCIARTFRYYPGSPDARWRYGRFDVHFEICRGVEPRAWHRSVPYANENATGNNMGFLMDGGSVRATRLGDSDAEFEAVIPWKECIPRTDWCVKTGQFRVKYRAFVVRAEPGIAERGISGEPHDVTVYRTP